MKKWLTMVAALAFAVLAGCSAGGSSTPASTSTGGTGGSTTATAPVLAIALSSTTVSSVTPSTVAATVKSSTGSALSGVVVTFSVNASVGLLSSTTALTNAEGVASVTLSPASATTSGADTIRASATVNALTGTASTGYQVNSATATVVSFKPNTGDASTDPLAAYGQAVLTLTTTGVSPASPVTFNVTSACTAIGKATISPSSYSATSNTTTFSYKDTGGCGSTLSSDTVTVSMSGSSGATSMQVYLTSPTANSITFSSATPAVIYLKGSGNVESSTVKFQVVDTANNPLPGQLVTLNLSTFAGGLTLNQGTSAVSQTSDSSGFVSVIVNSGTVPTPVRVTAKLASGVSTVSSNLAVVTGLPSQLNFSLSEQNFNIEGWNFDGVPNTFTIYAADRSGNPVPDGTTILFWAEGGQVQGSVSTSTTNGISSATASYVSASPRPADGRVTIVAYAIGEESFVDLAGTNVYQAGDPFQDLGNVVKSKLYDGIYDPANDEVVSLSALGASSSGMACASYAESYPQFALNNTIPSQPGTCDGTWTGKTYVRRAVETVLSSDIANPMLPSALLPANCTAIAPYATAPTLGPTVRVFPAVANSTIFVGNVTGGTFDILAADSNMARLNPMAVNSQITAAPVAGSGLASASVAVGGGTYVYPSTPNAQYVPVNFAFSSTTVTPTSGAASGVPTTTYSTSGTLTLQFVSKPSGVTTSVAVNVSATAPSGTCK